MIEKEPLQVKELLDSGTDIVLVDVREKWEFEYCHIPNSIHISVSDIPDNISKLETKKPHISMRFLLKIIILILRIGNLSSS